MPALETAPAAANIQLTLTRVIRAPRERVYQAWIDPGLLKQWFGPTGMFCPTAQLDPRVGGRYRIDVHTAPDNTDSSLHRESNATGEYTRIIPNELLQFTWNPSWDATEHTLVTISLRDVPEGTELTILHERFATEASRDGHNKGWTGSFEKLNALLAA